MKKYLHLLGYEMRTTVRDPLNIFLLGYPLFMFALVGWLLPTALLRGGVNQTGPAYALTMLITFVIVISIGGFVGGSLLGFSLLENKDEKAIDSIAVAPISLLGYVGFKAIYSYVFSVIGNLVLILGIKLFATDAYSFTYGTLIFGFDNIGYGQIIIFSLVSSLLVPTIGTLIASIAKNKIEGFAFMKGGGLIFMLPALLLLEAFQDWKQYLLGIVPNLWPVKALLNTALNTQGQYDLPYWGYMLIATIYMLGLTAYSLITFAKKNQRSGG